MSDHIKDYWSWEWLAISCQHAASRTSFSLNYQRSRALSYNNINHPISLHHVLILFVPLHTTVLDNALVERCIPYTNPSANNSWCAVELVLIDSLTLQLLATNHHFLESILVQHRITPEGAVIMLVVNVIQHIFVSGNSSPIHIELSGKLGYLWLRHISCTPSIWTLSFKAGALYSIIFMIFGSLENTTLSIRNITVKGDIINEKAKQIGSFMTHAGIWIKRNENPLLLLIYWKQCHESDGSLCSNTMISTTKR